MTPDALAHLHERAFAGQGRPWSAAEFADLLDSDLVFIVGDDRAFALGRVVVGEAELLTLATAPEHQRTGLGRARLAGFEAHAQALGATRFFLEVAADNAAAIGLYQQAGYVQIGRRKGYYARTGGAPVDAVVMEKTGG